MPKKKKEKPTWVDLRREVMDAGGVLIRQGATSHEIWRLPGGTPLTLQSKHRNTQVTKKIRDRIRDAIENDRTPKLKENSPPR